MLGKAYFKLGDAYGSLEQFDQAIKFLQMSLSIYQELGDKTTESALYYNIGAAYTGLRKFAEVIKFNERAFLIAEEIGYFDLKDAAASAIKIAKINLRRG